MTANRIEGIIGCDWRRWGGAIGEVRGKGMSHANSNALRQQLLLQAINHNSYSIPKSFSTLPFIPMIARPKSTLTTTVTTLNTRHYNISFPTSIIAGTGIKPIKRRSHETQSFTMGNSGHNSGHTEGGRVTKTLSRQRRKAARKALGSAQSNSKCTSCGTRTIRLTSFSDV